MIRRAAILCLLGLASVARADGPPVKATVVEVPPLALPSSSEGFVLVGGKPVSKPLQPIEVVEQAPASDVKIPDAVVVEEVDVSHHPLGRSWNNYEYLVWWPKTQPLPPLATLGRAGPPILGGANTLLLVGPDSSNSPDISGARFRFGGALQGTPNAGLEITYFFMGSRTETQTATDLGTGRPRFLGRPIVNAVTGTQDVIPISIPGQLTGSLDVSTTTRATGWEITGIVNLVNRPHVRLNALAGYRYFMVNEGLRIEQTAFFFPTAEFPPVIALLADQFDAHNRFHGGQLGLQADLTRGPVFVEATGKVGLGEAINVVRVSGQTVGVIPGPIPAVRGFDGGVLGQPTNAGRFVRSGFAVLPEAIVKVGYRFRDHSRLFIGYNFVYLSEAVRPGDQVDTTVDPSLVPVFAPPSQATMFVDRPAPVLAKSDFWAQGLVFGVEYRY